MDERSRVIGMNDPNGIDIKTNQDRRQDNNHRWFGFVFSWSRATQRIQPPATEGLLDHPHSPKWGTDNTPKQLL